MGPFRRFACALACLAVSAAARAAPPEQIAWAPGLAAAQESAKARNVPLLVVLNMDAERGNDAMVAEVYTAPAVREAAKKVSATVASIGRHPEADAGGRKVCSRFGHVTCDEHRATEEVVRKEWLRRGEKDDIESPRHIFRAPDGQLLFERVWTLDAVELVALIDRAAKCCTPEILAAWDTPKARLERVSDPLACLRQAALADLLGARDPKLDQQVADLAKRTERTDVASDVIQALGASGTPERAALVRGLLAAAAPEVRNEAAAAVARQKSKEAADALLAAFGKEKQEETKAVLLRAYAVAGGDAPKTRDFVLRHAKGGDEKLRVHAVLALAPWAKDDPVVDAVRRLPANEKAPDLLRAAACFLLGLSGRKECAADLKPATESRHETLKRTAFAAIQRLESGKDDPNYLWLPSWIAPLPVRL